MQVKKTIKLFIGGEFSRTESGRSFPEYYKGKKQLYANLCQASRKDLRNAVAAAQKAQNQWFQKSAYNRSQILYRMAEMTEGKRAEFVDLFKNILGKTELQANKLVDEAINAFIYYAGFADKFQHLLSTLNPVSGPYHNFSTPEPIGVVALVCEDQFSFQKLVADISAILCSGNALIVLLGQECSSVLAPLSEVFATSDLPGGVINLLTGFADELVPIMATHMEIESLSFQSSNKKLWEKVQAELVVNMKRTIPQRTSDILSLESLRDYLEIKTLWHPLGF